MSKYMRLFVMFDLPVQTPVERRLASQFRQFLLKDGYYMMQFSIYVRICNSHEAVEKHRIRLVQNLPHTGSVRVLVITERQFAMMEVLCGEKLTDIDTKYGDDTLTIL